MSTTSPGGYKPHLPNITGDDPADGETVQWDATAKAWKSVAPSGGGGTSTPPGQAAHYIGTWDVAVAYAAGECVRQWDGAEFKLYQAKKATTGDDPTSVVASWAEVTTPIVMWGTENPLTSDPTNPHGIGVPGSNGMVYLWRGSVDGTYGGAVLVYDDNDGTWMGGSEQNALTVPAGHNVGLGAPVSLNLAGPGGGYIDASQYVQQATDGNGSPSINRQVTRAGAGAGNAQGTTVAQVLDTAVGTAYAGDKAVHHTGGEAHVLPTADASGARNDVKADLVFTDNTEGPVIHDQSDGHTYRIVSTAGVLSTVQVT